MKKEVCLFLSVCFIFSFSFNAEIRAQELIKEHVFQNREYRDFKFLFEDVVAFAGKTHGTEEVGSFVLLNENTLEEGLEIKSGRPSGSHHGGQERYYHSFGNFIYDTATSRLFIYRSSSEWENHYAVMLAFDTNGNELSDRRYEVSPDFVRGDTLYAYHLRYNRYYFLQASNLNFELDFLMKTKKRFTSLRGYNFLTDGERLYNRNEEQYDFETQDFFNAQEQTENRDIIKVLSDSTFMYLAQKVRFDSNNNTEVLKIVMRFFDIEMNKLYEAEAAYDSGILTGLSHIQPAPDSGFWALNNDHLVRFDRKLKIVNRAFLPFEENFKAFRVRNDELHLLTYTAHNSRYRIYRDDYYVVEDDTTVSSANLKTPKSHSVFPNPTSGQLRISGYGSDQKPIEVYDLTGVQVKTATARNASIDLSNLPSGVYIVLVRTEAGTDQFRVVKK